MLLERKFYLQEAPAPAETPAAPAEVKEEAVKVGVRPFQGLFLKDTVLFCFKWGPHDGWPGLDSGGLTRGQVSTP